jgi:hypothetical protein
VGEGAENSASASRAFVEGAPEEQVWVSEVEGEGRRDTPPSGYALDVARRFDSGSLHDRKKVAVAQLLARLYDIMAHGGHFFTSDQLAEFKKVGTSMVSIYADLHAEAFAAKVTRWKFPPKGHLIHHLVTYQAEEWGNPSYYWCYADEDLVGLTIEIARACHHSTVAATALAKWLILAFNVED